MCCEHLIDWNKQNLPRLVVTLSRPDITASMAGSPKTPSKTNWKKRWATHTHTHTWGPYFGSLKAAQKAVSLFGPRKLTDQHWHHAFSSILRRAKMERILDCPDNALSQHGVTTPAGPITKTEKGCIFKVMGASLHNTWSFLFGARKSLTKIQRHRPSLPQAPHHKAMACEVPAMQLRQLRQKQEDFHQECSCSQQLCQIRLKQEDFHQKSSKNNPGATHTHWKHNIGNAHPLKT